MLTGPHKIKVSRLYAVKQVNSWGLLGQAETGICSADALEAGCVCMHYMRQKQIGGQLGLPDMVSVLTVHCHCSVPNVRGPSVHNTLSHPPPCAEAPAHGTYSWHTAHRVPLPCPTCGTLIDVCHPLVFTPEHCSRHTVPPHPPRAEAPALRAVHHYHTSRTPEGRQLHISLQVCLSLPLV